MAATAPFNKTIEMVIGLFIDICISYFVGVGILTGHAYRLMPPAEGVCAKSHTVAMRGCPVQRSSKAG